MLSKAHTNYSVVITAYTPYFLYKQSLLLLVDILKTWYLDRKIAQVKQYYQKGTLLCYFQALPVIPFIVKGY